MRKTFVQVVLVTLALTALLSGCASSSQPDSVVGSWGSTQHGKPGLVIKADGSFSGTDGCNRMTGTGSIEGSSIVFGTIATTLMACEGVDTWLSRASRGLAGPHTLTIYDATGSVIGTLNEAQ